LPTLLCGEKMENSSASIGWFIYINEKIENLEKTFKD